MNQAITTDPDIHLPVVAETRVTIRMLLDKLTRQSDLDRAAEELDLTDRQVEAAVAEIVAHYSQPPEPSASIKAAAAQVATRIIMDLGWTVADIREILHRHFATASRAERAMELLVEHISEWAVWPEVNGCFWHVRDIKTHGDLARADNPVTAILRAGGEET